MASYTHDDVIAFINHVEEAGVVYNVDFKDWKSRASRAIEDEIETAKDEFRHGDKLSKEIIDLNNDLSWDLLGISVMNFPSKKLKKRLENIETDFFHQIKDIADKWEPVSEKFKEFKKQVIMGHKPSTTPRKTKERTLENTGTCPCCGRNIKLENGKMVHHGFELKHGMRNGSCFGVGFKPWEVSPEGKIKMIVSFKSYAEGLENDIKKISNATRFITTQGFGRNKTLVEVKKGDDGFERLRDRKIDSMNYAIRAVRGDIEMNQKMVDQWVEKPLPDSE